MPKLLFAVMVVICVATNAPAQNLTAKTDPDALADLRIGYGNKDIAEAWFIAPTTRYAHFVQGSHYEAGGLRVRLRDGSTRTHMLDAAFVFEHRQMRLADLDGDGKDELIVVQTALERGASLAAYSIVDGALKLKAQTPYIGQPFRWLNPAGIADFDGDGSLDVALVAMPHLVKRLELWTLEAGKFNRWGAFTGFSNHRNGSVHTGMSAVADFDGDGVADLALPGADRRSIAFVSLQNRSFNLLKSTALSAPVDGPMTVANGKISVTLSTGKRFHIDP